MSAEGLGARQLLLKALPLAHHTASSAIAAAVLASVAPFDAALIRTAVVMLPSLRSTCSTSQHHTAS